jgi:hypothetical protein
VVVGSPVEVVDEFVELGIEVTNQLLDRLNQLLEITLSLQVQFGVI